jgi:hypothetical protein
MTEVSGSAKFWVLYLSRASQIYGGPGRGTQYDMSEACPLCGTGARLTGPLILRTGQFPKKADLFPTLDHELIVSPQLSAHLRGAGVTCLGTVQGVRPGNDGYAVLQRDATLPPFSQRTQGYEVERQCPECKRDGHFNIPHVPLQLVYDSVEHNILAYDVLHTWECFGNSALRTPFRDSVFASPLHVVSNRFRTLLEEFSVRRMDFDPVVMNE